MTFIECPCEFTSLLKEVERMGYNYIILKHTEYKYSNSLFLKHRIYIMT